MRVVACFFFVIFFSCYAYKRWFVSLCAAIVLMAVLEHPDMPRSIGGIQGFNLWNILIFNIVLAWWLDKKKHQREFDAPKSINVRMWLFVGLIMLSTTRLLLAPGILGKEESFASMFSEFVINCVKWLIPSALMFDACRDRRRVKIAITCILAVYVLLALQVIRWMPLSEMNSSDFTRKSYKMTQNEIGYNRVTLSMMLGGGSWAVACTLVLAQRWRAKLGIFLASISIMLGQALTGGRTGYGCWLMVGLTLCILRWRKLLLMIPVAIFLVLTFLPAVRDRMLQGIVDTGGAVNQYEMTSGRNIAWPFVIMYIKESPLLGYGRQAMVTQGIRDMLLNDFGEEFPHPHNAYLESFLDNGIVGLIITLSTWFMILRRASKLLLEKEDMLQVAVGGICFSLVMGLLFGAFGGQTFYPREGYVCMWASIGVMFRVSTQRERSLATGAPLFPEDEPIPDYEQLTYEPSPT